MIDKSFAMPLLGFGLLAFFVIHPYLAYAAWALALAVLMQELVLAVCLPLVALVAAWNKRSGKKP